MKNLVALLCMVSALVGSVYSIKCYSCESRNSPTCDEKVINCEHRCVTESTEYFKKKVLSMSIEKGCIDDYTNEICGREIQMWDTRWRVKFISKCCDTNLCNTDGYAYEKNKKRI
ncbi:uncharacterized protein ACNLHF_001842 [Anomaloglossus baeobatrachus]